MRIGRLSARRLLPYQRRTREGATITWRDWLWEPNVRWHGKITFEVREGKSFKQQSQSVNADPPMRYDAPEDKHDD